MSTSALDNQMSLIELAKRSYNGEMVPIAEVLDQTNDMLSDAFWAQANDSTTHTYTRRTQNPSGSYKKINKGIAVEASLTQQIREPMSEIQGLSQIDEDEYSKAPDGPMFRMDEDRSFIEGLSQTAAQDLIYGNNNTDPEKLLGLANRSDWNGLATPTRPNVIGAGGTGDDTTSLWIIQWADRYVSLRYPRNMEIGLKWDDKGVLPVIDSDDNTYFAYTSKFGILLCLVIKDIRCVQRIANIETAGSSNTLDDDDIVAALNKMPQLGAGAIIYVNRVTKTQLDIIGKDQGNINYTPDQFGGVQNMFYRGIPVHLNEQILNTESAIS